MTQIGTVTAPSGNITLMGNFNFNGPNVLYVTTSGSSNNVVGFPVNADGTLGSVMAATVGAAVTCRSRAHASRSVRACSGRDHLRGPTRTTAAFPWIATTFRPTLPPWPPLGAGNLPIVVTVPPGINSGSVQIYIITNGNGNSNHNVLTVGLSSLQVTAAAQVPCVPIGATSADTTDHLYVVTNSATNNVIAFPILSGNSGLGTPLSPQTLSVSGTPVVAGPDLFASDFNVTDLLVTTTEPSNNTFSWRSLPDRLVSWGPHRPPPWTPWARVRQVRNLRGVLLALLLLLQASAAWAAERTLWDYRDVRLLIV